MTQSKVNFTYEILRLMRVDRPIGYLLLLWPTWWALWLAAGGVPPLKLLVIFTGGVILMRSAGCVINDFADRKIDPEVARTKNRPLAKGAISPRVAIAVFLVLITIAGSLLVFLNNLTRLLALIAVLITLIYPFCKRFFILPQLVLGSAFAMSVPMSFAATLGSIPWTAWWLFAAVVVWTFVYDTFYAMVDQADDAKVGVYSSALFLGKHALWVTSLLQLVFVLQLSALGSFMQLDWRYQLGALGACLLSLYQQYLLRKGQSQDYFKAFSNNSWLGLIVWLGIWVGLHK